MATLRIRGRSKYRAVRTTVCGIAFDSKREAARYLVLKAMADAGEIADLELQPTFALVVLGGAVVGRYVADFAYTFDGARVVEDCKGVRTPVYRLKKKMVESIYGISILET